MSNWNQQMLKHGRQTVFDGESALEYPMFLPSVILNYVLISPADEILSVCIYVFVMFEGSKPV